MKWFSQWANGYLLQLDSIQPGKWTQLIMPLIWDPVWSWFQAHRTNVDNVTLFEFDYQNETELWNNIILRMRQWLKVCWPYLITCGGW